MGVGLMERARIARQPAHLLLASEFGSATLNEKGSGEYDPSFVITKLGANTPHNRIGKPTDSPVAKSWRL